MLTEQGLATSSFWSSWSGLITAMVTFATPDTDAGANAAERSNSIRPHLHKMPGANIIFAARTAGGTGGGERNRGQFALFAEPLR